MYTAGNKREFTRVMTQIEAAVAVEGHSPIHCQVNNVSLNGVLLSQGGDMPQGTRCSVRLTLGGIEPPVQISAQGTIIRATPDSCAIEFNSMDGDSYDHLRRLVLENAADTEAVENEFDDSIGIHKSHDDF